MRKMIPATQGEFLQKLYVKGSGEVNGLLNVANLVDSEGNPRFVEGDIEAVEDIGLTLKYGKWSLSGSHLMIVFACDVADTTVLSNAQRLTNYINLPQWIKDKIVNIVGSYVQFGTTICWGSDYTQQLLSINLNKSTNNVYISCGGAITFTKDRTFRVQFDLLIDTEPAGE